MYEFNFDDYSPSDMEKRVEQASKRKAGLSWFSLLMLSVMAGSFIALGSEFFTLAVFDSTLSVGFTRLIGGFCFSLGLILVIVAGAELFTGNNLVIIGFASGIVNYKQVLKNWVFSYIGNFVGSISVVYLMFLTNLWKMKNFELGAKIVQIASDKTNLTFIEGLSRGILCNALVCLAVWLCFSARSVISKIGAIIFPITAFVASGFEHSIANMYFIPMGMLIRNDPGVIEVLTKNFPNQNLSNLNAMGLFGNLFSVTLGNIIGGAIMVGVVYWLIIVLPEILRKRKITPIKKV
ncbi:MAG: formate/nitrite transporter family protein [Actinobacteria bacterium]|nr:formate/nitrite transporter family protein [Actinomycetota bacterium]MBM3712369.1 formate/nitrite transporter family protein [Actinomycetota bacterium]